MSRPIGNDPLDLQRFSQPHKKGRMLRVLRGGTATNPYRQLITAVCKRHGISRKKFIKLPKASRVRLLNIERELLDFEAKQKKQSKRK